MSFLPKSYPFTQSRPLTIVGCCLLGLLGLARPRTAQAQNRLPLTGSIATETGAPVEFATITLHRAADSVVVKTEFSDAQGGFRLEAPGPGNYRISAAQVGFSRYWSPVLTVAISGLALPPIRLAASAATALKEVTVTGRKLPYERLADRTVVNVADSPQSAGATTLDVLGRAPGVTTDAAENLALRGRKGLLVVVDGRRLPLTGSELADYLRSLPAGQVQSIELITNPPAQYDAQGGAGVIAINLKKDQRLGTNGNFNLSYGRGEYGKFSSGVGLNHRRKNLNLYGNYAYSDRRNFVRVDFERQYGTTAARPAAGSILAFEQVTALRSHSGKVGLDLTLRPRTQLAASATLLASQTDYAMRTQGLLSGPQGELAARYHSTVAQDLGRPSGSLNLSLRQALADSATAATLAADADYAHYRTSRALLLTKYPEEPAAAATMLNGDQRSDLSIGALRLDFSQPRPHRARLDAGLKATRIRSDNAVAFVNIANGSSTLNPFISNNFQYDENVNAAYLSWRGTAGRSAVQAGLRAEQTNTRAEVPGELRRERHYLQLFPTLSVHRPLGERHALGLALARRIDRPTYGQLNPLRNYLDATSYRAGNPDLVAQTSNSAELTYTYRQKFVGSLSYVLTDQPFVNVVQPSPDGGLLVVNQDVNLSTEHYYALTLTAPLDLTKWLSVYANGVFYYARFVGRLADTDLDRGRPACTLTLNTSLTLPHGWSADVNGLYESSEQYGFERISPRGQLSAGLQKSLFNRQATLRLNAADVLYTTPFRVTSTYQSFAETFYTRQDSRVVTAAFTYRFGSGQVAAARKHAVGAEDELRRAAGQ
ncbi:MAG: TonB dependent receptor [Bacteroidota bacterium]|nr:TonB dependent receptor [Bacteroidota bacterium]